MFTVKSTKTNHYIAIILALLMLVVCVCGAGMTAFAEEPAPGVLAELEVDETFNVEAYPARENDYSLDVIQLAETKQKTVVLYVYQPSGDKLRASTVNISAGVKDGKPVYNYSLKYIALEDTISKYEVTGLEVSDARIRTYDVVSIFRKWDSKLDKDAGNDNHVSEVAYLVGKCWSALTIDGNTLYDCTETETVTITDKFVGMIQYSDGINWNSLEYTHSHFVAFSTDRRIDRLYEADVLYNTQVAQVDFKGKDVSYGEKEQHYDTIKYDDVVTGSDNWFAKEYKFNRIQTTKEFLETEDIDDEDIRKAVAENDYVLRICETPYDKTALGTKDWLLFYFGGVWGVAPIINYFTKDTEITYVSDVSVLRLLFETDGVTYNVGVVDNKQTGSGTPLNLKGVGDIPWWVWLIVAAVVLILIVTLCPPIFNFVVVIVKCVFNVIMLPFKLISQAAKNRKKNGK